jgi:hypothetical protein
MAERKSISKKIRFEVFKRDSFTCQYCGRSAPDIVLEVDHIIPVAKNGTNDIYNLITSCFECNRGKKDKKLTDTQATKMQKKELDRLNKRKEQLEMMAQWQQNLIDIEKQEIDKIIELVNQTYNLNISLTESGTKTMLGLIKKYKFKTVMESSIIAFGKYEDIEVAFKKISNICYVKKTDEENPILKDLYYIRAIMRNRFSYIIEHEAIQIMQSAIEVGTDIEKLKQVAKDSHSWTEWKRELEFLIDGEVEF